MDAIEQQSSETAVFGWIFKLRREDCFGPFEGVQTGRKLREPIASLRTVDAIAVVFQKLCGGSARSRGLRRCGMQRAVVKLHNMNRRLLL